MWQRSCSLCAVVALVVLASDPAAGQQIRWQPSLSGAQQLASQTNRLVLVHFWAPWCGPCRAMEREVFSRPDVARSLDANYVAVKLNVDDYRRTVQDFNIKAIPCDVILTPDGREVQRFDRSAPASQYIQRLDAVATQFRPYTEALAAAQRGRRSLGPEVQVAAVRAEQRGYGQPEAPPYNPGPPLQTRPADPDEGFLAARQEYRPPMPGGTAWQGDDQTRGGDYAAPSGRPDLAAAPSGRAPIDYGRPPYEPRQPSRPPYRASPAESGLADAGHGRFQADRRSPEPQGPPGLAPENQSDLQLPPGSPPLGLDGYCPVQLVENNRWDLGNPKWGAIHEGRTYLFAGPDEQRRFLEHPERYAPVMSGDDPVLAIEQDQRVPGRREFGQFFQGRIYLFANQDSLRLFYRDPHRYAEQVRGASRPRYDNWAR